MEFPSTAWRGADWSINEARPLAPVVASWSPLPGVVRHTFTHFQLELAVLVGSVRDLVGAVRNDAQGDGDSGARRTISPAWRCRR